MPADVTVIGAGTVGVNATQIALGMGANVIALDTDTEQLRYLDRMMHGRLTTLNANPVNIAEAVRRADLLIGAVLIKGAKAPRLVTREMVRTMEPGSVIVDVSVDQGGCVETIHPATHSEPVFLEEGVLHYGVTNIPGAVPRTSTYALSNATIPFVMHLAEDGIQEAVKKYPELARGVNTYGGKIAYRAVAEAFDMGYTPIESLLDG